VAFDLKKKVENVGQTIICRWFLIGFVVFLVGSGCAVAQETRDREDIEAAMVFAASKFVAWPQPIAGSFDVCIAGEGRLSQFIQGYEGKRLKGVEVKVRVLKESDALTGCRTMIVPREMTRMEKRLESARDQPIMTIGDAPGFVEAGGIMGFLLVDGKVRFEVNLDAAKKSGLSLGSQMVGLAVSVKGAK